MALTFRKSIKVAPGVNINLNKSSRSTSRNTTPNTYTSNLTNDSGSKTTKKKKGRGCLTALLVFFGIGVICSLFPSNNKPTSLSLSADTETVHEVMVNIPITISSNPKDADLDKIKYEASGGTLTPSKSSLSFVAEEAGTYNIYADCDGTKSNTITLKIEDKKAIEEQKKADEEAVKKAEEERIIAEQQAEEERIAAEQKAEEDRIAAEQQAQANNDPVVYITNTGGKYHNSGCRFLKDSKIESHLSEVGGSYGPCGVCNPPTQ